MHVLPLHRLVHLSPNTPTSKSTVHHNSANTFRLAHVLQKLFSLFLGSSWPCTFSAPPFPILVTGEQTGKAIVAGHLNGVPLEDLLGAAELQDADPEEDLSGRPNESDPTHVDSFFADLLWDIVGLCGFKVLVFVDVLQGRILQLFAMFGTGK